MPYTRKPIWLTPLSNMPYTLKPICLTPLSNMPYTLKPIWLTSINQPCLCLRLLKYEAAGYDTHVFEKGVGCAGVLGSDFDLDR